MRPLSFLFLAFSFFFLLPCAPAQESIRTLDGVKKRDRKTLTQARQYFNFGEYGNALPGLDELIEDYPDIPRLRYMRAVSRRALQQYDGAVADLREGLRLDGGRDYRVYRELGETEALRQHFPAAVEAYRTYRDNLPGNAEEEIKKQAASLLAEARLAAEMQANPLSIDPRPVAGGVNTPDNQEYFPSLSPDGRRMIFTRNVGNSNEDFYESELGEDGQWSAARPLAGVNSEYNEAAQTITADGNYLVFTACDRPDGQGGCDLYYSERRDGRWTPAENLGPNVNTAARETQPALSADGQLLFFASKRSGGQGKHDIYVSARLPDGKWGSPRNLGPTVNTDGEDVFPFWAGDNRTLFFTSTGHPGLGGADLFKTTAYDTGWTNPQNLGYPINTAGEETNLYVTLDGRTAYFSKSGVGGLQSTQVNVDIFQFELPEKLRPAAATYLEALVTDAGTGRPLRATVRLQSDALTELTVATDRSGYFLTVLPSGTNYGLTVEKEGYLFYSDRFQLDSFYAAPEPYRLEIALQPVTTEATEIAGAEEDGAIALRNVFFETASATLLPQSTNELDRLAELLKGQPELRVEIAGHTDAVGEADYNQRLSEDRAGAVRTYLIGQGVAEDRVTARGYGEQRPIADNDSETGRAGNRRVTFRLID